jgi:hypothetical protein
MQMMPLNHSKILWALPILGLLSARVDAQHRPTRLDDDPRLAAPVSLATPMMTIEDVLLSIGQTCKVSLTATKSIRDDTVMLFARDRPARAVLQQLADTLGYDWEAPRDAGSAPGYRMFESATAATHSRLLRMRFRRATAAAFDRDVEPIWNCVQRYAGLSINDQHAEEQELEAKARSLPFGPEHLAAEKAHIVAQQAAQPQVKALLAAFMALPASDKDRMLRGERVIMATPRGTGAAPMPAEV